MPIRIYGQHLAHTCDRKLLQCESYHALTASHGHIACTRSTGLTRPGQANDIVSRSKVETGKKAITMQPQRPRTDQRIRSISGMRRMHSGHPRHREIYFSVHYLDACTTSTMLCASMRRRTCRLTPAYVCSLCKGHLHSKHRACVARTLN